MTLSELLNLLNRDLSNEYMHMHFYLHSAMMVTGLHRAELREFFLEEAAGEMQHVTLFGDLLLGMGVVPTVTVAPFPIDIIGPIEILQYALEMETTVVNNYVERMAQATEVGGTDGKWIEIFLEDQVMKSRQDVDHLRQILRNATA